MASTINAGRPAIPLQNFGAVPQPPPRPIAAPNPPHAPANGPAIPGSGFGRRSKWLPPDCWNFCVGLWGLVVTIAVFAIALVLFKPQLLDHQLNTEDFILSGKSYNPSAWTAHKDFRDDCRSQNVCLPMNSHTSHRLRARFRFRHGSASYPRNVMTPFLSPYRHLLYR